MVEIRSILDREIDNTNWGILLTRQKQKQMYKQKELKTTILNIIAGKHYSNNTQTPFTHTTSLQINYEFIKYDNVASIAEPSSCILCTRNTSE
jgi:hypothetical protein